MLVNINKYLRLCIWEKLVIVFISLAIVPVLIVGIAGLSSNVRSLKQVAIKNLQNDLHGANNRLTSLLQNVDDNVHFLIISPAFREFVAAIQANDSVRLNEAMAELIPLGKSLAQHKRLFYQIKFIDPNGAVPFAIELQEGAAVLLSPTQANWGGTQYYLYLAAKIPANKTSFFPTELRQSSTGLLLPAITCIYPIKGSTLTGILVFHIYADVVFKILEQETPEVLPGALMLVNSEGFYLYHSEEKKEWNKLLASKEVLNLKSDFGDQGAAMLLNHDTPGVLEMKNRIVARAPLFSLTSGENSSFTLLKSVPKSVVYAPIEKFRWLFYTLLALLLLVSLAISYVATQQFIGPINKLKREAKIIAGGNYRARVNVETFDEIEDLARQFNIMAESLYQHEMRVIRHRQLLRDKVKQRTKELEEERNTLKVILNNVPSGFMLVDDQCRILSASAALESIANMPANELLGKHCGIITGCAEDDDRCIPRRALNSGRMQIETTTLLLENGQERILENVAIPLKMEGRTDKVLEIISDITERIRLQDRLVRSEKLASTGEMAAVVAHTMRNSLTSVRMILQLAAQGEHVSESERESFDVALDSLMQMETLVNELLHLSRPARLEKRKGNLNEVILDSIELARHQIINGSLQIEQHLQPDLPVISFDQDRMKDAFVNLILNATQAVESDGQIAISSFMTRLPRELLDLAEVSDNAREVEALRVREVVLKKGDRVIQVDVRDSGTGIAKEHLGRIFDPFFTTKVAGTGLGLPLVKRVVNEHGGIIQVKSTLGQGSCFSIYLPIEGS